MQIDLKIIYQWVRENLKDFIEEEFEQISHGTMKNITVTPDSCPAES